MTSVFPTVYLNLLAELMDDYVTQDHLKAPASYSNLDIHKPEVAPKRFDELSLGERTRTKVGNAQSPLEACGELAIEFEPPSAFPSHSLSSTADQCDLGINL